MHYPVVNKAGDTIASAVTNLDLHDISRVAKTYGVNRFFVVTPLKDQQRLVKRIVSHWMDGAGSRYNPKRHEAMRLIRMVGTYEDVLDQVRSEGLGEPKTVATSANTEKSTTRFAGMRSMLGEGTPFVLVLGTAWGLAEPFMAKADYILEPLRGTSGYNHLSVRSAAAIIFDRLLGRQE